MGEEPPQRRLPTWSLAYTSPPCLSVPQPICDRQMGYQMGQMVPTHSLTSPQYHLFLTGNPLIRLQQSPWNSTMSTWITLWLPFTTVNPHVTHGYLYSIGWGWQRKCQRGGKAELDPKDEGSSLGREEKAFLVEEAATTKILSLLGNSEQLIQARTQSRE